MPGAWSIPQASPPAKTTSVPTLPQPQAAPDADPSISCVIDNPDSFVIAGQSFHIHGWATAPAGIASLAARIDGALVGIAHCNVARPDVAPSFPHYVGAALAGYHFPGLIPPATAADIIELQITATSHDGGGCTARRTLRLLRNANETIAALRTLPGSAAWHYVQAARAFADSGDFATAEALAAVAAARFPTDPAGLGEFARVETEAVRAGSGDAQEACRRWTTARQRFPEDPALWVGESEALVVANRFEDADTTLLDALRRFPGDLAVQQAYCSTALHRAEMSKQPDGSSWWPEAEARWRALRRRTPDQAAPTAMVGYILLNMNRYAEAEALLTDALRRWPDDAALVRFHAMSASERCDWPEAERRLANAMARYPDDPAIAQDARIALFRAAFKVADDAPIVAPQPIAAPGDSISDRDLMLQFESLGFNCDLGLLQRKAGAEPLGLLRFARTQPDELLRALAARFAGVGDPEHTKLITDDEARPEYRVCDARFGIVAHTFIFPERDGDPTLEGRILAQQFRHRRYLAARLVHHLEAARKIFVYQTPDCLPLAQIEDIFAAVNVYGRNTLLYVSMEDSEHPAGSLELVRPRLLIGRTAAPANDAADYPSWRALCLAAYRQWLGWRETAEINPPPGQSAG